MKTLRSKATIWGLVAIVAMGFIPVAAWGADPACPAEELLSIGQPGRSAIGLRVWISNDSNQPFQEGDRLIVSLKADRDAHVTALSVSSEGDVTLLVPNKHMTDTLIRKDKVYTWFGDDSRYRLTLGKQNERSGIALYLSTNPPNLEDLTASKKTGLITISGDALKEITALREALEAVAKTEGFNRVPVSVTDDHKKPLEIVLSTTSGPMMGAPRPMLKKLPTSVESTPPETVTGVQGVKPEQAR